MHCSDIVRAWGVGVSREHPLFTLKLFCGNALWNVFKLSELKNLQLLDWGGVLNFYDVAVRLVD